MGLGRPGPAPQTAKREQFARLIAQEVPSVEACRRVGSNPRTGKRWRHRRTITSSSGRVLHYPAVINTRQGGCRTATGIMEEKISLMPTSDREVSSAARHLAKTAVAAFGGTPRVQRFYNQDESHSIDILICAEAPSEPFTTYSTLGVYEAPNMLDDNDVRVELAGVAPTTEADYPNMLATAASFVQQEHWLAAPGVTFPALVREYGLSDSLEHVLWVPPFPWDDLHEGYPALEQLFEQHQVAYYDLQREPLV